MGHFDRSAQTRPASRLPERLQQLDRELMKDRTKDFDYLYATRHGFRIRVCVMRDEDGHCYATAQLADRAYKCGGGSASGAFWQLTLVLGRALALMNHRQRQDLRRQMAEAGLYHPQPEALAA
jgi:hypothetical protein